ncbi:uncharacterized protein LOC117645745 [Thrips palmi]|uniref:Uncharacterized protein LOC117645745 n=1 Tax=Thrips palmi TaxID=161013 RepID=A0A6P8Z5U9_THRPL|nr:uncharacterized protein LOC117645745 [Thrips palmi]
MMSRHGLAVALLAVVMFTALVDSFPAVAARARRVARSTRSNNYYPELYAQPQPQQQRPQGLPQGAASSPYLYPDDYDEDTDYSQEQWWDSAATDTAANAAFLQNLMEANQLNDRLDRMGLGQGLGQELGLTAVLPAYAAPPRYLDPRYRDSDDYVFGSVNAGTTNGAASSGRAYEPAAYGRYQYRVDQEDDDDDVRELHALAKKSRTEEQRLQDLETQALIKAALGRRRDREEQNRRVEFADDASEQLDQDLEKLFAKSGLSNMYHGQEPKPWNGRDPIWNGYYMGSVDEAVPQRATRSKTQYQYLQAPASTKAPVPVPAPAAASTERPAARTTTPASTTTKTTTTTAKATPPTPPPMKRTLSVGQRSGQPEVALLRPAKLGSRPRPVVRAADLLSLLPSVSKRSAPIVADEGSLVEELSALKKKSD